MTISDLRPQDLQSLLSRGVNGDRTAYDELLVRTSRRLPAMTRKMLRNYPALAAAFPQEPVTR